MEPRVSFLIAGAQKAGTTALHSFISKSPHVFMPAQKELHFFDSDFLDWSDPPYDQLHRFFPENTAQIAGEATPIYSYWPQALERIQAYNPAMKLIFMLRHPAHRAVSAWKMETVRGAETRSFSDAISQSGRDAVACSPNGVHRVFSYVERGFYAPQVQRMQALFPADQILFATTDILWQDRTAVLSRAADFLGVPIDDMHLRGRDGSGYRVPVNSNHITHPNQDEIDGLAGSYADDIRLTMQLTGLDLQHWLAPDFQEQVRQ
jgi:hypothetical protein